MITTQILDAEELKNRNEILETEVVGLKNTVTYLNGQLEWFKRQLFGKKSERLVSNCDEKQLFLEGFENLQAKTEEETQEVPPHKRRKPNRDGKDKIALDPDMPVERTVIDLPEEEKICQETGKPLVKIGEEVTHKLAHEPGSYYIKEIIRLKYAHPEKPEAGIQIALLPDTLLPKCQADDSFLAHIITEKFASHMPLYRIAEKMELEGVKISRKLLSQ
jgi:transposase